MGKVRIAAGLSTEIFGKGLRLPYLLPYLKQKLLIAPEN
jgi:hypothetical protein